MTSQPSPGSEREAYPVCDVALAVDGAIVIGPWPGPEPAEVPAGSLVCAAIFDDDHVLVVRATGEIDVSTAPAWRRAVLAAARIAATGSPGPTPRLACDLRPVTFLAAAGLPILLELVERTDEADVELEVIVDGSGGVHRVLEISGLSRLLPLTPRPDDDPVR